MFSIYADGELLYSPDVADQGFAVIDPKLTEELNKAGSLEFTMPTNNPLYNKLQKLKTEVVVKSDNKEIWWGRVLHDEKDWYNRKHVYCEGLMSYLLDSVVRPYDYTGSPANLFGQFIIQHNKYVDASKQFMLSGSNVTDANNYVHYSSTVYPNTLSEIMEKLVNTHGGYLKVWRSVIGQNWAAYNTEYGKTSDQVIEFGKNLLDISEYIDASNVFTVIVPAGARQETTDGSEGKRLTIESVNNGKDYLEDAAAIKLFGRIERNQVWEDVTTASQLKSKAAAALKAGVQMAVTLSIKALDLHIVDVDTERIALGDYVRVVSEPHGLDKNFLCSKIVTDMQSPDKTEFTLGVNFSAMTDQQIQNQKRSQDAYYVASSTASTVTQVAVKVSGDTVSKSEFSTFQTQVNTNFDAVNSKLASVYHVKGSVDSYKDLPSSHAIGDVYNLLDTGANYVWTKDGWDKLSETIDLSGYATKQDLSDATAGVDLTEYQKTKDADEKYATKDELGKAGTKAEWTLLKEEKIDLYEKRSYSVDLALLGYHDFIVEAEFPVLSKNMVHIRHGSNAMNQVSRDLNTYAANYYGMLTIIDGQLHGVGGFVDGWAYNIPASMAGVNPRQADTKNTAWSYWLRSTISDAETSFVNIKIYGRFQEGENNG